MRITHIGGPTALLEIAGLRLLTDPTFDPAGTEYPTREYTLRKLTGPAVAAASMGRIGAVLLSHDHHLDNLDHSGRKLLPSADAVFTTLAGAERLGGNATGLAPWQGASIATPHSSSLSIVGTPARHGPEGGDRGPVTGFVLSLDHAPEQAVYISGDTVWYDGAAEAARRFPVRLALLFMGAARIKAAGAAAVTMTAEDAVHAARAMPDATIVPVHYEGWEHFSESRDHVEAVLKDAGVSERFHWLAPGQSMDFSLKGES